MPTETSPFCHAVTLPILGLDSIGSYLETDVSSGLRVFETRFSRLSAFRFGAFCAISTPISRDMIKTNYRPRSIELVEIFRSVVKSSKLDPSRSRYGDFSFPMKMNTFANRLWGTAFSKKRVGGITTQYIKFQGYNFTPQFLKFHVVILSSISQISCGNFTLNF